MARLVKLYYNGKPVGRAYQMHGKNPLTKKDIKEGYSIKTYKKPMVKKVVKKKSYGMFANNPFAGY